jgi:hypothetical protein
MRKNLSTLLLLISLFSCNTDDQKKPALNNDTPSKIDTPVRVLPPVTHYTVPDHSPMDMIYFPGDYPLLKMAGKTSDLPLLRIVYSRPQKQGRKIFDGLVKYNVPWRLGANESTEIEFFSNAKIQNKMVKAGRYILYCIPQETKWTFVLNSNLYSWGLQQNRLKDVFQFEVPVEKNKVIIEYFTIAIEKRSDKSAEIIFLWDDAKARLPVNF